MGFNVSAIIPAAGLGSRMEGGGRPKQFLEILGKSLLHWTVDSVASSDLVGEIIIVASPNEIEQVKEAYLSLNKVTQVVEGGDTRAKSVYNGLLASTSKTILIHDGARPCVTATLIKRVFQASIQNGAATAAVETTDTLKLKNDGLIGEPVDRSTVLSLQTPQLFQRELLLGAYDKAIKDGLTFDWTDETSLLKSFNIPVAWAEGDSSNIKVTRLQDLKLLEFLLENR